jgi:uncharacterized coiled-coil DUF342 family protein
VFIYKYIQDKKMTSNKYTCNDYRQEMILMALEKRLATSALTPEEEETIKNEIKQLQESMGMD